MDHASTTNQNWLSRFTRGVSITVLGLTAVSLGAIVIIWNSDLYTARDRWEHIKLALYGDWQSEGWCPSGRNTKECTKANEFEAAFADVDNFNFFKSKPIEDTDILVTTGVKFATARDVLTATTNSHWCYITYGSGAISSRLDLGMQDGQSAPVYADFSNISNDSQTSIGLSVERLHAVARTHCQFGPFDLTEGKD